MCRHLVSLSFLFRVWYIVGLHQTSVAVVPSRSIGVPTRQRVRRQSLFRTLPGDPLFFVLVSNVGTMGDVVCSYCGALKWSAETEGVCCAKGKVQLPTLEEPPRPLYDLLQRKVPYASEFIKHIRSPRSLCNVVLLGV